jgi:two-component system, NarL family, response regulator LiaR
VTRDVQVMIADNAATRLGIKMALAEDVSVCAEADDAEQAIRAAKRVQPHVCLVGYAIAGRGPSAIRGICRAAPNAAVVVLADVGVVDDMLEAVRAGAVGYVPGPLDAGHLRRIIGAVVAGEAIIPRSMVLELLLEMRSGGGGGDVLTGRESQVLGMLRRGQSTAAIAKRLQITPVTVRRHVSEIVRKLGVEDRTELVASEAAGPGRKQDDDHNGREAATGAQTDSAFGS